MVQLAGPDPDILPMYAVLSNFASAVQLEDEDQWKPPFRDGFSIGGTTLHLPPEIVLAKPGRGQVLNYVKSDIFAIGMTAYAMLAPANNQLPFGANNANHTSFTADSYVDLPACYSDGVRNLVRVMVAPQVDDRLALDEIKAALAVLAQQTTARS